MSSTPKFVPRENKQKWKTVPTSQWINDMCNPIREIVEQIKMLVLAKKYDTTFDW